jgi:O-antigen biosynthesis protein
VTRHDLQHLGGAHHQALEVMCVRALQRGDIETAYRLSDRRCRIRPLAEAHCYVLRSEALYRMGERAGALADLATAIQIAPDDLAANRRMLAWGAAEQQNAAARTLIEHDNDAQVRRRASAVLRANGQSVDEQRVVGGPAPVAGDPLVAEVALPEMPSPPLTSDTIERDAQVLRAVNEGAPNAGDDPSVACLDTSVTVILPVYADYEATRTCLDGLLRELDKEAHHRAIIVNDASPDDRIRKLIDGLTPRKNLRVLTNAENLGFVGTINRALKEIPFGDIILLNADTIIPPGLVARLSSAARLSPEIGTVTPLSNNGEFTSFPVPNRANDLTSVAAVEQFDQVAARVNADGVVDIPNGIGFCLYITRACLDAVGALSEDYHRGYLEDVDFCLRARQHGFRHVCATSIFVGHAGTRSFGKQKRSLVVRNLQVIEQKFPNYRRECAVFLMADPLKAARQAIESAVPPAHVPATLLVTVGDTVAEIARERARHLLASGESAVLILEIRHESGRIIAKLRDAAEGVPQSLEFDLPGSGLATALLSYLQLTKLARIEFLDLARIPRGVVATLLELSVPHDVFVAHTELGLERRSSSASISTPPSGERRRSHRVVEDPFFWSLAIASADRVLVPDGQAEAFMSRVAPRRKTIRAETDAPKLAPDAGLSPETAFPKPSSIGPLSKLRDRNVGRLGLVSIRQSPADHQFIRGLISALTTIQPELDLVVVGSTSDDDELLRSGPAFVTGSVDASESEALIRRYRFDRLVSCLSEPLFGHPGLSAVMTSVLPVAYFDWSRGRCPARTGDLPLDPSLSATAVAQRLGSWLRTDSALDPMLAS